MSYQDIFIKNFQYYMDLQGKKPVDISRDLLLPKSTISSWMTKQRFPKMNTIEELAKYFDIKKSDLLENKLNTFDKPEESIHQYPFIPDNVAAGSPCPIEGVKKLPTISIPDAIMGKYARNKNIVIMKVSGESMNNVIPNGSFIVVKTAITVNNLKDGDLVVFDKNHEYSLKRFFEFDDKILLKPDSKDIHFTDLVYRKDEELCIIGKVIKYMVDLQ